jgi:hypothetical protein
MRRDVYISTFNSYQWNMNEKKIGRQAGEVRKKRERERERG